MAIIEAEGLTYGYPGSVNKALLDVNLKINKGEFVILAGPSGCGKSTLCRCFNGLVPHFYGGSLEGSLTVAGLPIAETPSSVLSQHVGYVFQNPESQLFSLSVEKDVAFGPENLGLPRDEIRERVEWALELTGISELREKAPYELSGGEIQRVAIASVLAMKPEIIVFDEPTSSLDPVTATKIVELVSKLNREADITVILVEHRLDLVVRYSNRIIIMNDGKVQLDGEPRDVLISKKAFSLGIAIPKVISLYQELKDKNILLPRVPLMPSEEAELIKAIFDD